MLVNLFHGFCMALADSVPGVSGGTIAFILGFYDRFLNALHDLFSGTAAERKAALCYLVKLGLDGSSAWGLQQLHWHRSLKAVYMCSARLFSA